ncbi:MAG: polyphosphate kinase 1, partial [Methanocorpusculum sp.]|nr:polyphosphate kinase 1 [Methanocorpusculum sp.]
SWLKFNDRVLSEAADETVPLIERLKFLSIFTSNLDEFFMIRVGSLYDLTTVKENTVDLRSGMSPKEQLDAVYAAVRPLYEKRERIYFDVEKQLRIHGSANLSIAELDKTDAKFIKQYYKNEIAPILSPQIVDAHHPFPHLQSKVLHIGAVLQDGDKTLFGVIPVPDALPDIVRLPGADLRYVRTEEILLEYVANVFSMYEIAEKTVLCITRNADINPEDEAFDFNGDFRSKMQKLLAERRRLAAVRLELSAPLSAQFLEYLCGTLGLSFSQVYVTSAPLKLGFAFSLAKDLPEQAKKVLTYKPFIPRESRDLVAGSSIFKQIAKRDVLLSYPFESMSPFLRMMKEAANDKNVISIKITIYRLASKTKLVDYLCTAAENGKDVTVMIELRARFDEQNNIDWSERLEDAGCKIIFGFEEYKIHSKICLITRKEKSAVRYYLQVGTGNYNERTAEQYTDVSLMTANQVLGAEAAEFFKNMAIGNLEGAYAHLLVSPVTLKNTVIRLIDEEMAKGTEGRILIKINSLTDVDIIEKFKQASCAGVKIDLIVRGICCLLPGVAGKTENITVRSVVGRFLEHSRMYCFGEGAASRMYISSADFMTRNTERRVEVACPVYSEAVKAKLHHILDTVLEDNVKARILQPDGSYARIPVGKRAVNSQLVLLREAESADMDIPEQVSGLVKYVLQPVKNAFR